MKLIVGLGNPGSKYINTRHNIGFTVIDTVVSTYGLNIVFNKRFNACIATFCSTYLMQPMTYMNLSGYSVLTFVKYYKIQPTELLVIHDDIDLFLGRVKYKIGGSSGGHNGVKSIDKYLNSCSYYRIRIGIGRPPFKNDINDYVLAKFNEDENIKITGIISNIIVSIYHICAFNKEFAYNFEEL